MPILIVVIALIIVLAVLYPRLSTFRKARLCQWRSAPDRDARPAMSRWRCDICQVEAYSSDDRPPKECKRTLKSGL